MVRAVTRLCQSPFVRQEVNTRSTHRSRRTASSRWRSSRSTFRSTWMLPRTEYPPDDQSGELPPKDAVRVEEMINYFSYAYPQPMDKHPVRIVTETTACPWNKQHQLMRIGVKAKEIPTETLPSSNFVFLIDVSGSIYAANKLPLVKASLKLLVNNLRESDRVAIVAYAGAAGEVLPSTEGTDKQKILDALEGLQAGEVPRSGGYPTGVRDCGENFVKGEQPGDPLCTDGDLTWGYPARRGWSRSSSRNGRAVFS